MGYLCKGFKHILGLQCDQVAWEAATKGPSTKQGYCHEVQGGGIIPSKFPMSLLLVYFYQWLLLVHSVSGNSVLSFPLCHAVPATSQGQSTSAWKSLSNINSLNFGRSKDFLPSFLLSTFWLLLQITKPRKTPNLVEQGWQNYENKMSRLTQLQAQWAQT